MIMIFPPATGKTARKHCLVSSYFYDNPQGMYDGSCWQADELHGSLTTFHVLLLLCQSSATCLKVFSGEEVVLSAERCCAGLIFCASNLRIPSRC